MQLKSHMYQFYKPHHIVGNKIRKKRMRRVGPDIKFPSSLLPLSSAPPCSSPSIPPTSSSRRPAPHPLGCPAVDDDRYPCYILANTWPPLLPTTIFVAQHIYLLVWKLSLTCKSEWSLALHPGMHEVWLAIANFVRVKLVPLDEAQVLVWSSCCSMDNTRPDAGYIWIVIYSACYYASSLKPS